MKIGFTGTQNGLTPEQQETLLSILKDEAKKGSEFHHGDCIGADSEAHTIARELGLRIIIHPPRNRSKRAYCEGDKTLLAYTYLVRNHHIVDASEVLIACPKHYTEELRFGTWATIRYARLKNKRTIIIYPDGSSGDGK